MKIGKYDLKIIENSSFGLDGGAMFGIIPQPLWQMGNPPDEINRVKLNTRTLLLISDSKKILIDTGIGGDWDEKFNRIYNVEYSELLKQKSLASYGVKPEDITDVILTHLHFDHTGGSTKLENGKWVPAYPNAKYHVQKKHFNWAINPSDKDKGSFIKERFMPLMDEGVLNITESTRFDDEISFCVINGHTIYQQMVKISDSSNTLLYCGDLFPFSSHIPLPYIMAYDLLPMETVSEKRLYLPQAVNENWLLFFEHDPFSVAATVTKTDKGFSAKDKFLELPE